MTTLIPKYYEGATGSVNRPINQKLAEIVSVKDFGAVGNGIADDTAAIQAACNASACVYFPEGNYAVRTITINNSATLYGDGVSATTISRVAAYVTEDSDLIQFNGTDASVGTTMLDYVNISGIKFTNAHTYNGADTHSLVRIYLSNNIDIENCYFEHGPFHGIKINGSLNIKINGCTFYQCGFDGIGIGGGAGLTGAPTNTEKVIIDSNIFEDTFNGSNIQVYVNYIVVSDNICKKSTITFGQPCNSIVVSGNIIDQQNTYGYTATDQNDGIFIEGDTNVVLTGNLITSVGGNGIYVLGSEVYIPPTTTQLPIRRVLIEGNNIYAATERGINVKGSSFDNSQIGTSVSILNNIIDGSGNDGILLSTTDGFEITGNWITNSYLAGITIGAAVNGTISNNRINNCSTSTPNSYAAIFFNNNTHGLDIFDNSIYDTTGIPTTNFAIIDDVVNTGGIRSNTRTWGNRANSIASTYVAPTSAVPTLGSWTLGDQVQNFTPSASSYMGWVCTTSGTFGTLAGVTGSITISTKVLTVNSVTGLEVGQYITIAGVSGTKKITSIVGLVVGIDSVANATVTSAAVAYATPVFKGFGLVQA